jgi:hypothetical protein
MTFISPTDSFGEKVLWKKMKEKEEEEEVENGEKVDEEEEVKGQEEAADRGREGPS